ncbi:CBO0543 family protein [Sporolactobacillus sp. STCC-11]|uniref:CBO0543 family protein n=1 Tax=Sporolactobacillus caesalpiniae TaxID=3230362 RepID=UPI003396E6D8
MYLLATIYSQFDDKVSALNQQKLTIWYEHSFLNWRWWLGVVFIIVPILIWITCRDKKSADRLQYAGLLVALVSSYLDYVGIFFRLWRYDYEVVPFTANYFPTSFTILPISIMFLLQIKPHANPFIKAVVFSVFSLAALLVIQWIGLYQPLRWNYLYSMIIQFFLYLFAHVLSTRKRFEPLG